MMTPEARVKSVIKTLLTKEGVYFYMPVPGGFGAVGVPDILCCVPTEITEDMVGKKLGVFFSIECKARGKEKNTTPNQKKQLQAIHDHCGVAIVASKLTDVADAMVALKKGELAYSVP